MSGEFDQAKGRAKKAVGDLTGDREMQAEGEADETSGKIKEKFDDAVDSVRDKLDKN
ncbi:MAG: general stress protein CsbD [Acidimicrobiaceae bacterium]|nr:general stress protein CsbD [Acidimicrobiaceae bacterium]